MVHSRLVILPALAAATLVAPTTTPPSSATPDTSVAPDTSAPDADVAISDALVGAYDAANAARFNVDDPAIVGATDPFFVTGSPARRELDETVAAIVSEPVRLHPVDTIPSSVTVEQVLAGTGAGAFRAGVIACAVDAYDVMAGDQVVAATTVNARRVAYELRNVDGTWQLFDEYTVDSWNDSTCPPPDPIQTEHATIAIRVQEIDALRRTATGDLRIDEVLFDSIMTRDGDTYARTVDFISSVIESGRAFRRRPDLPNSIRVESIELLDGPPATMAILTVCAVDAGITVEPNAAPDGSDVVVNDDIGAFRLTWHLTVDSGLWKLDQVDQDPANVWAGVECTAP